MRNLLTITLLALLLNANSQENATLENYSLKNGVKVYFIKYGQIEAVNISVIMNCGKKNEAPGFQGYNSIVSSMLLMGNATYSEEVQNDKAFSLGISLNAYSNSDYTAVECNALTKNAGDAFDLLSNAIRKPLFSKEKTEQFVSYLTDYNNPSKMDIAELANTFSDLSIYGLDHPLGRSIYKKQLQLVTPEKLKEFHSFNYTPKNCRIVVTGNFNSEEMKKILDKSFSDWQSSYGEINGVSLENPSIKKKEIAFVNRKAATQCALQWNKSAPSVKDKDLLAFTIANRLFNQTLFREIREKGGKTYGIGSSHRTSQFSNLMSISCSVRSNEMLNTIQLFDKTLEEFSKATFNKEDFDNEVTGYRVNIQSMDYPSDISAFFNPMRYAFDQRKNILKELSLLTPEDVQKAIKKYFTPGIYKLVISGDESLIKDQLAKITGLKTYSYADLELKN